MLTGLAAASTVVLALSPIAAPPIRGQGNCHEMGGQMICTVVAEMPVKSAPRSGGRAAAPRVTAPRGGPAANPARLSPRPASGGVPALTPGQLIAPGIAWNTQVSSVDPCAAFWADLSGCGPAAPARAAGPAPAAGPVVPQISPEQLRQMAMDDLTLTEPHIQSAPCSGADCKGAVGVPAWFWVPQGDWTPQSATATAGTDSVTATATPTSVTWELGDGTSITCSGPGTPYDQSKGWAESPDCGSKWLKAGSYTLTSTLHWTVTFTGSVTDTQDLTTTSTAPVDIGEYQVLVKGH